MKLARSTIALALCVLASGCARGALFTYVTEPLTTNLNRTPVVADRASGSAKRIQYNSYRIDWGTMAIGEIANRVGFETIYYADLTTLTIAGVWIQRWVHVYGVPKTGS